MLLIGVILTIVGLCLSYNPVKEGMANTDRVILAGIGPSGNVYVATSGLTGSPNWTSVTGTLKQVSGSLGQMVGISTTNAVLYGTQYSVPGSPYSWVTTPVSLTQLDFDYPTVVGIDSAGLVKYINDITSNPTGATLSNTTSTRTFKWISMSIGRAYAIGTDNKIYYAADVRNPAWIDVTGSIAGKTFSQVSYEGENVVVLDSTNKLYYADSKLETAPNWKALTGNIKQISLKDNMLFGVGTDDRVYFSPSQTPDTAWVPLSGSVTMSYISCFFPRSAEMVKQRPALITPCTSGYSFYGGQCLNTCPTGFRENETECAGVPVNRDRREATVVPPLTYTCDSGYDVGLTGMTTCVSLVDGSISATVPLKEVYAITGSYTQVQAQAKCTSYGGALATSAQVTAAQSAGADWCSCAWTSDGANSIYPISRTGTVPASCGGSNGVKTCSNTPAAANCFGVKPPQAQFTDILPFNGTTNRWNQAPQCGFGFNLTTTGMCNSTCPTGSYASEASCIYPVVPKPTVPRTNVNYTCPTGYDPPPVSTCSGSACGAKQTCTQVCPSNYTRNGTECKGNSFERGVTTPQKGAFVSFSCDAGWSKNGDTCYQNCKSGERDGPMWATCEYKTGNKGWLGQDEWLLYSKAFKSATANFAQASCPLSHPNPSANGAQCFSICPMGTALIDGKCIPPSVPARLTQDATYIAPCPSGYTDSNGGCYQNCPTGSRDLGNNTCQIPNGIRLSAAPKQQKSALTICNFATEELIGTQCVTKCAAGLVTTPTTCAQPSTKRTGYTATSTCSSNEVLLNGVCTTKCPDGTYPDGELCVPNMKIVAAPSSIKCTSSVFGKAKKWLCDTQEAATTLLKDPSSTTSYVDPNDQVCIADDPTTSMYYCESGAEAKANTGFIKIVRNDYKATCDNVKKNYMDLSNNITSLLLIQSGVSTGRIQLANAKAALDSIHTKFNCATPSSLQVAAICQQIKAGSTAINTNSTNIGSILSDITTPIVDAMASRDSLLASIANFQCSL